MPPKKPPKKETMRHKRKKWRREEIANKIRDGKLLTNGDYLFLQAHHKWVGDNWDNPYTAEDAAKARQIRKEKRELAREIENKVYAEVLEKMLGMGAKVQMLALQRALIDATDPETGEFDPYKIVDKETQKIALGVAKEVQDRVVGKATQKIQGEVKHSHEHTIWKQLANSGKLDGHAIEDAEWRELEAGDDSETT